MGLGVLAALAASVAVPLGDWSEWTNALGDVPLALIIGRPHHSQIGFVSPCTIAEADSLHFAVWGLRCHGANQIELSEALHSEGGPGYRLLYHSVGGEDELTRLVGGDHEAVAEGRQPQLAKGLCNRLSSPRLFLSWHPFLEGELPYFLWRGELAHGAGKSKWEGLSGRSRAKAVEKKTLTDEDGGWSLPVVRDGDHSVPHLVSDQIGRGDVSDIVYVQPRSIKGVPGGSSGLLSEVVGPPRFQQPPPPGARRSKPQWPSR
jgi:hypothetical protein